MANSCITNLQFGKEVLNGSGNHVRDSRLLIDCPKTTYLWLEVENWIRSLGMERYCLTDRRKILGDLENPGQINIIILNTKKKHFSM